MRKAKTAMSNVIFMGTPDFAAGILQALIDSEYEVTAVFTQPDKPRGRSALLEAPPAKKLALSAHIPVYQPAKIREAGNAELIESLHPDFIVVAAFGQIIPKRILDIPKKGILNVHASLLPRWRGAAPIQWSILTGDKETGVTIMQMEEGLDTGAMIDRVVVPVADDETGGSLFDKLMKAGAVQIVKTMRRIEAGEASCEKQPQESPTPYAKMLTKKMGEISWEQDAAAIERMVRAFSPWPSAYTFENGRMFKIWKAGIADPKRCTAKPGEVVETGKDFINVQTGKGILTIFELQPEGKKRMSAGAFLRGSSMEAGTVLGRKS